MHIRQFMHNRNSQMNLNSCPTWLQQNYRDYFRNRHRTAHLRLRHRAASEFNFLFFSLTLSFCSPRHARTLVRCRILLPSRRPIDVRRKPARERAEIEFETSSRAILAYLYSFACARALKFDTSRPMVILEFFEVPCLFALSFGRLRILMLSKSRVGNGMYFCKRKCVA